MPAEGGGPGPRVSAPGAGRSILVVDDDPLVRQLLVRMLESSGYAGQTAADAAEARQRLDEQDFAAILIDVRMPGESGIDLLKHVAAERLSTAPVMVTASDDHRLVETAFQTGAYGYVVKPFRMSELLINITNALHRRDLEMRNRNYIRELEEKVARHRTLIRFDARGSGNLNLLIIQSGYVANIVATRVDTAEQLQPARQRCLLFGVGCFQSRPAIDQTLFENNSGNRRDLAREFGADTKAGRLREVFDNAPHFFHVQIAGEIWSQSMKSIRLEESQAPLTKLCQIAGVNAKSFERTPPCLC